jgi:hypothetical protein
MGRGSYSAFAGLILAGPGYDVGIDFIKCRVHDHEGVEIRIKLANGLVVSSHDHMGWAAGVQSCRCFRNNLMQV